MKIAIISDIHSNLEALIAVQLDIISQGISQIFCLGDVVGYGPFPKNCLNLTRKISQIILKGNHEDCVCNQTNLKERLNDYALEGIKFSIKLLTNEEIIFMNTFPLVKVYEDLDLSLSHGSFHEPEKWIYIENPQEAKSELKYTPTRICLIGHTHIPYVFGSEKGLYEELPDDLLLNKDEKFLINVGSVGQPRDGDCRASYGVLEYRSDGLVYFNLRRVFYDISITEEAMKQIGLPVWLYLRLFRGE